MNMVNISMISRSNLVVIDDYGNLILIFDSIALICKSYTFISETVYMYCSKFALGRDIHLGL